MKYYVKERYNPQLGTHFYYMGQMSKRNAALCEKPIYGFNTMHVFDTQAEAECFVAKNISIRAVDKPSGLA